MLIPFGVMILSSSVSFLNISSRVVGDENGGEDDPFKKDDDLNR